MLNIIFKIPGETIPCVWVNCGFAVRVGESIEIDSKLYYIRTVLWCKLYNNPTEIVYLEKIDS